MSSDNTKQPKEVEERIKSMEKENQAEIMGVGQITNMLEKACKLYVKSKTDNGVSEATAIQWVLTGLNNTLADLAAYSVSAKYVPDLKDLVIALAQEIHDKGEMILEDYKKPKSDIIVP